jgi:hypothetical protein
LVEEADAYTIILHLEMWWFLAGDGIVLQCIATTTTAATASLPPSAVQTSEGGGVVHCCGSKKKETVNTESKFLFICDTIQIDSLGCCSDMATNGGWKYLIGGVQLLDRIKSFIFVYQFRVVSFTCLFSILV